MRRPAGFKALLAKDLRMELRSKHMLPTTVTLGVLIAWIFRLAAEDSQVNNAAVAAAALMAGVLFAAILAGERSFAMELQNNCMSGLKMSPLADSGIYFAKLTVNTIVLSVHEVMAVPAVLLLFGISPGADWAFLVGIMLLVNIGTAAVATLLACATQTGRAQNSLLSILLIAVLMPMMIPAIFTLERVLGGQGQNVGVSLPLQVSGGISDAVGYLIAFDVIFVTLCWLLFDFVIND